MDSFRIKDLNNLLISLLDLIINNFKNSTYRKRRKQTIKKLGSSLLTQTYAYGSLHTKQFIFWISIIVNFEIWLIIDEDEKDKVIVWRKAQWTTIASVFGRTKPTSQPWLNISQFWEVYIKFLVTIKWVVKEIIFKWSIRANTTQASTFRIHMLKMIL